MSVAMTLNWSTGGQFIAQVKALPVNSLPNDGRTIGVVLPRYEGQPAAIKGSETPWVWRLTRSATCWKHVTT